MFAQPPGTPPAAAEAGLPGSGQVSRGCNVNLDRVHIPRIVESPVSGYHGPAGQEISPSAAASARARRAPPLTATGSHHAHTGGREAHGVQQRGSQVG